MAARAFYVMTYDITDDKRRTRVAKLLEQLGERVQDSVFELYMTPAELDKTVKRAVKLIDAAEDSVRVYYLCDGCRAKVRTAGVGKVTPPPGVVIV